MSTKETLRQLARLFSPPTSSSSSSSESPFPDFTLPDSVNALLDEHLRSFAASLPPLSGTGGTGAAATSSSTGGNSSGPQSSSSSSEGERERARWREGLLEIWSAVEPLPGTESKRENLARVSAFLVLLHRLSADVGEDDDVALVSRRDIGSVWWSALLKRAMLGAPKDGHLHYSAAAAGGGGGGGGLQSKGSQTRGRKLDRKGRDAAAPATTDGATSTFTSTASPLYVSRQALAAAMNMIVWGMQASREHAANSDEWISPFGVAILHEYEQRALVRLQGYEDEGWGVRNLEECLIQWGEKAPKAFFVRVADSLTADSPPAALIPFVSLTLSYLSRHSTKAYYALSTPLLGNLITTALTTPSAAVVSLALRSLAIFVVTLPVVIGDYLFGIMAVYGRAVSWEIAHDQMAGESGDPVEGRGGEEEEEREEPPPDPMMLFTTLYGIYPCNFTAFLREPVPYLQEKGWEGATGDGRIDLASGIVRSKSEPYIRQHALSPALFSGDAASELSDTQRWSRLEAADVMAACDRNVISAVVLQQPDWRGAPPLSPTDADAPTPGGGASRGRTSSIPPGSFDPLMRDVPLDSASPTPKHVTPEQSPAPSRAASRARSPIGSGGAAGGGTSPFASPHSSRVSTPHMPPTTLYANFHALQSVGALNSPTSSASRSLPPRSQSRRRPADSHYSETTPHHGWLGFAPDSPAAAQVPPPAPSAASMSRRSSGVASLGTSLGLLSPDLIPFGRGSSPAPSHPPPSSSSHQAQALPPFTPNQVNAQLVKLETELVVLQGEVNFQNYLKQLHLQHMGTLHREKVLESGAEAERQSSFRTIRTLRAQLRATQNALDQVRSEQAATKANWTSHIADLRDKLAGLREQRMRWEHEERVLRAELDDWKDRCEKKSRELEQEGAEFLDLRNQASTTARYIEEDQVPGPGGRWIAAPPLPPQEIGTTAAAADGVSTTTAANPTPLLLFRAYRRSFPGQQHRQHDSYVWIEVDSSSLVVLEPLRKTFPTLGTLYDPKPAIDLRSVYAHADELLQNATQLSEQARTACAELVSYAQTRFAYVAETVATYPPGMMSFHLLWSLFRAGQDLEAVHETTGERIAIRLDSWAYVQEAMGRALALSCHFYQWAGTCYHKVPITRKIRDFVNLRAVNELPAFPLSDARRASLAARGQLYTLYAGQVHAEYEGFFFTRAFSGVSRLLGDGQVMIDVKGYRRTNPALDSWSEDSGQVDRHAEWASSSARSTQPCQGPVAANQLHLLPPALHGFSFRAKRWGEFLISRLAPIQWTSESFSHLVIPDAYRRIVKALVTVHSGRLKDQLMIDVVAGKGNGLVMCFHGSPGTGKTLTAEAIAEHLRRPLYVVSAGELGILPQVLENQLRDILALATEWNAVLLIDEADIFLQKRDASHLERNALVGVFLRQLEYFSGVLLLTTNSIKSFDDAFLSRFAVVLHFDKLDTTSRRTLWSRFLERATGDDVAGRFDVDRLANFELNGREIKHAVQTAQAVALVEGEILSMKHLEEVLSVARSGAAVGLLAAADTDG